MRNDKPKDWFATAETLSKALPYLQRYDGATVVIKLGGHAMGSDEAMASFARDVVLMRQVGVNPVVVHGGGPMINDMLDRLGIQSEFVNGKRVTDAATVEVVEMVLSGTVNKRIVQAINAQGGRAVGLSGKDASLMICEETDPALGFVGTPAEMNAGFLNALAEAEIIPVIAPIGTGAAGETYNVNGDTAAGAIAAALKADRLLLLTDVAGVKGEDDKVITEITPGEVIRLTKEGIIAGGMIPKTETALQAMTQGVRAVVILDGRAPNACLLELFTEHGAGTLIKGKALDYPSLTQRIERAHLAVLGGFHPDASEELGLTLVLLGPLEPHFWPHFIASAEYGDGEPHAMDRWSARVVGALALEFGGAAHFPFGGPPYAPFIQWAKRSGRAWQSPAGPLVHDHAGMMVSFRGALALPWRLDLPPLPQNPCETCADQPCLSACPVGALSAKTGYDIAACHDWLDTGAACMSQGCAARRACPVSQGFPRLEAQSAFHMRAFHP